MCVLTSTPVCAHPQVHLTSGLIHTRWGKGVDKQVVKLAETTPALYIDMVKSFENWDFTWAVLDIPQLLKVMIITTPPPSLPLHTQRL